MSRRAKFPLLLLIGLGLWSASAKAETWAYIEPDGGPRFYLGDEDTRLGRAHFIHGDYGLAETYFRRAVEVTPQNSAAWVGLAASYDRLGRFDLAERAYRRATSLLGPNPVVFNNHGYSYLLRGRVREAERLLHQAASLAPGDPTILKNIEIARRGQDYFWGTPYLWGWALQ